ncbi:hypothetical protein GCM10010174_70030 [Kutzneria viridogrisea]|uniref:DUF2510 domain-containing protein n=1 Tax=Kutzneria viridogrisea TaxID=47990 RepID=A0ABR6BAV6_9PSEU|nr:hypothetical protein [Kutzneria viridogrisea]
MPAWTMRGRLDSSRWLQWTGSTWTADAATTDRLQQLPQGPHGPALCTPVGPVYRPEGEADEVALYLNAAAAMPGGPVVTGNAPALPPVPPVPNDAVS